MNVLCCGIVLLILLLVCCVYFMAFYQWRCYLTGCVFYHYWRTVYRWYALGGWIFKQKLHILQSIPNLFLVGPHWVLRFIFSVCGILAFFCNSSQWGETRNIMRQRQKSKRRRSWAGHKLRMSCFHPLRHCDALSVKKHNMESSLEIWLQIFFKFRQGLAYPSRKLTVRELRQMRKSLKSDYRYIL